MFLELIESETQKLNEDHDELVLDFLSEAYADDFEAMKEELGMTDEAFDELKEALVKRVNSKGQVTKVKSRKIRKLRAPSTTGMSRAALKMRGRKSAKARKRSPGTMRVALKKRRKALKRRKQMGIK